MKFSSPSRLPYKIFFDAASLLLAIGWLLLILGICLAVPLLLAFLHQEATVLSFLISCCLTLCSGGLLVFRFSGQQSAELRLREGLLLTILSWVTLSFFASLPFYLSGITHSLTDAVFESVSALTTTGVSILEEVHYVPQGLRFWRIFLQWLGGFGIILMAVTLLPLLKIGGTQLMTTEFSDRSEKIMPRASHIALFLMGTYTGLTFVTAVLLVIGKVSVMDALYYGMSAISAGGIMVSDQPLILLTPYCKIVLMITMVLGGSTLMHLIALIRGQPKIFFQDDQIRSYYRWLLILSMVTVFWIWKKEGSGIPLVNGVFMAISASTTTGYSFGKPYDSFLSLLFLMASMIGGCSGSTAGGFKFFRIQILYRMARGQLLSMLKPYGLFLTVYNYAPVEQAALTSVITTVFLYAMGWLGIALGFSLFGHSFSECLGLSASLITNSGLALNALVDHLEALTYGEKWLAILAMLCGRFEFITLVCVMLIPFWRR